MFIDLFGICGVLPLFNMGGNMSLFVLCLILANKGVQEELWGDMCLRKL